MRYLPTNRQLLFIEGKFDRRMPRNHVIWPTMVWHFYSMKSGIYVVILTTVRKPSITSAIKLLVSGKTPPRWDHKDFFEFLMGFAEDYKRIIMYLIMVIEPTVFQI